ncbi:DUF5057 domain-containing protein [Anaeromicropila populeti]|uniref:Uncharacterized protein n=1 Tax=Anaeromicropila populeti TaxID=37658 RepID=A0A1I6INW2_9FIRM|nr:DUF5057 domain-containing protein [Anaeromicropila populeti]SFR68414.1 protein of unknown function [Anaeromicropila populeti]
MKDDSRRYKIVAGATALLLVFAMLASVVQNNFLFTNKKDVVESYSAGTYTPTLKFRSTSQFRVLEIVPERSMAVLGYSIEGEEPIDLSAIESTFTGTESDAMTYEHQCSDMKQVLGDALKIVDQKFVNNDYFIKYVLKEALELTSAEVNYYLDHNWVDHIAVDVETINEHPELIDEADLIYIHEVEDYRIVTLYEKYSDEYRNASDEDNLVRYYVGKGSNKAAISNSLASVPNFAKKTIKESGTYKVVANDISWEVAKKLYEYARVNEMPLILSGELFEREYTSLNIYKLGIIFSMTDNFTQDEAAYGYTGGEIEESELYYKIFEQNDFKNGFSFKKVKSLYYDKSKNNLMTPRSGSITKGIINSDKIYGKGIDWSNSNQTIAATIADTYSSEVYWGYDTVAEAMLLAMGYVDNGDAFRNLKEALKAATQNKKSTYVARGYIGDDSVTTVMAIGHGNGMNALIDNMISSTNAKDVITVIANANKPRFRVLDLEPSVEFSLSKSEVRKWFPDTMKSKYNPLVVYMSMAEFIGSEDDLNSEYDLIYIGSCQGTLLDAYKFYETGIMAESTALQSSNGTDSAEFYYSGNDITLRKVKEIEAFIAAGYPVVYRDDVTSLVADLDSQTASTGKSTIFQEFFNNNKAKMKAQGSFTGSNKLADSDIDKGKAQVYLLNSNKEWYYKEGMDRSKGISGVSGFDNMSFYVKTPGSYKAYLYVDSNNDGIFNRWKYNAGASAEWKQNNNFESEIWSKSFSSTSGGSIIDVSGSAFKANVFGGGLPWRLEVVKMDSSGNESGIRSSVSGVVYYNKAKQILKVLHVGDDGSKNLLTSANASSYFNQYINKTTVSNDYDINVTFMDVDDIGNVQDEMKNFDICIYGFLDDGRELSANEAAVAAGLVDVSKTGKGIIIVGDCLTANNRAGINKTGMNSNIPYRSLLNMDRNYEKLADADKAVRDTFWLEGFTYITLNENSSTANFKYSHLNKTDYTTNVVTQVNPGKITEYPYTIDTKAKDFSAVRAGNYQLNLEEDAVTEKNIITYYCLGDTDANNQGLYTVSDNNATNNYYLFQNDNIYYTGITKTAFSTSESEVKLFVNTIVAALHHEKRMDITIEKLAKSVDNVGYRQYFTYADYDFQADAFLKETEDITFSVDCVGMDSTDIVCELLVINPDTTVSELLDKAWNRVRIKDSAGNVVADSTLTGSTASAVASLDKGKQYSFPLPLHYLSGSNAEAVIQIKATDKKSGKVAIADIQVLKNALFELN